MVLQAEIYTEVLRMAVVLYKVEKKVKRIETGAPVPSPLSTTATKPSVKKVTTTAPSTTSTTKPSTKEEEELAKKLQEQGLTPETISELKKLPIPTQREKYGVVVWPSGLIEKELLSFRSTLQVKEAPKTIPGRLVISGWVKIINPNNVEKTVMLYPIASIFKMLSETEGTWVNTNIPLELCVCGRCGRTVRVTVPAKSTKHCNVEIVATIEPVKAEDYQILLKAYYTHPKYINGKWVTGGTEVTVSAVDITDIVKKLSQQSKTTTTTKTGEQGVPESYVIRQEEKAAWSTSPKKPVSKAPVQAKKSMALPV